MPEWAPQSHFPHQNPCYKTEKNGYPQISAAQSKHQLQPDRKDAQQEKGIAEGSMPGAEGAQKVIPHAQKQPQPETGSQPLQGNQWRHHPNSRRHPPADRGSS